MITDTATTQALILDILAAVEDPSRWQAFLEGFNGVLRSDQSSLMVFTLEYEHKGIACYAGATEEDRIEYMALWIHQDPWMTRAQKDAPEGVFIRSNEITPDHVLEGLDVYQQYLKPRDWHYGGGVILLRSPVLLSILATSRSKAKGPITNEEKEWIEHLVPYLQTAARLHEKLTRLQTERDASQQHLDLLPHGLAMVGPEGYLLAANRRMRAMLAEEDGLYLRDHRLSAQGGTGRELRDWLKRAQSGHGDVRRMVVTRTSTRRAYWVTVTPTSPGPAMPLGGVQPIATVLAIDPESRSAPDAATLATVFDLTPAESRLAVLMTSGLTVQEAAGRLHISAETAKTHLKRILSKTATRRQSEMISLFLTLGSCSDSV